MAFYVDHTGLSATGKRQLEEAWRPRDIAFVRFPSPTIRNISDSRCVRRCRFRASGVESRPSFSGSFLPVTGMPANPSVA